MPRAEQRDAGVEELLAEGISEENLGVAGVDDVDEAEHDDRQQAEIQPVSRPCAVWVLISPLRRMRSRDDVEDAIEDFGEVAAGILLHEDAGDEDA